MSGPTAPAAPPASPVPAAAADRQDAVVPTFAELKEEFAFLGDWEAQCEYLMDLGLDLPRLPAELKSEDTRVHGCQSNVWMTVGLEGEGSGGGGAHHDGGRLRVAAESDAMIVNGLVAVLLSLFDGQPPRAVLETDEAAAFAELGLYTHLSGARKSGLAGMVQRIRGEAARFVAGGAGGGGDD